MNKSLSAFVLVSERRKNRVDEDGDRPLIRQRLVRFPALATALVLAAGACSAASPSATAPASALAAPTAAPALPLANPLTSNFKLYTDKPTVPHGPDGSWYSRFASSNAAVYYDGKFHVFHDGGISYPAMLPEGYAYSTDGINFSRPTPDEPVLGPKNITDAGLALPGNMEAASVLVENGTWVMYFTATAQMDNWYGNIGRATAPAPTGPWTVDKQFVFEPNATGTWDKNGVGFPSVSHTADGWFMWYGNGAYTGMATSKDGISWTRYDDPKTTDALYAGGDPVLQANGSGGYDSLSGSDARVVRVGGGWMMTYLDSTKDIEYATSTDGIHWTAGVTIVEGSKLGLELWWSSLLVHDGTAYLYFEASATGADSTDGYLATWKV